METCKHATRSGTCSASNRNKHTIGFTTYDCGCQPKPIYTIAMQDSGHFVRSRSHVSNFRLLCHGAVALFACLHISSGVGMHATPRRGCACDAWSTSFACRVRVRSCRLSGPLLDHCCCAPELCLISRQSVLAESAKPFKLTAFCGVGEHVNEDLSSATTFKSSPRCHDKASVVVATILYGNAPSATQCGSFTCQRCISFRPWKWLTNPALRLEAGA